MAEIIVNGDSPTNTTVVATTPVTISVDGSLRGPAGPPNSLSIGAVTTGSAGSSAIASITGTSPAQVLNLTLPLASGGVSSVNTRTGAISLAKSDVGLSNVDNTSDASKPISTSTQTALNAKESSIVSGTTAQYYRGDKSFVTLTQDVVPDGTTNKAYTATEKTKLAAVTGTNTGDQTLSILGTSLTISGQNTVVLPSGGGANLSQVVTSTTVEVDSDSGTDVVIAAATASNAGVMSAADKSKLDGIASGATANAGTVTSVSVTTANGVSGSVATATSTPAISLSLGAITPSSVNGVTLSGASTPTLAITGTTTVSGTNTGDQTTVSGNAGTATTLQTARTIDGQSFNGSANITVIAPGTHAATTKATPVDADELPLADSAATFVLKKLTWANAKATLKTYFDTLYPSGSGTSSGTNTGDQTLPVGGTPAVVLGSTAAAGVSPNFLRRDDTIVAFDVTSPSTQVFGDAAAVGVATVAARRDHKHAMPAAPTTVSGNAGTATALQTARSINGVGFDGTANITLTPRTNTTASSATPAINTDTTDIFTITALALAITSMTTNLTGTPVNGQKLQIRFKDNGTARAITWGTSFVSSGVATLLATTVISKTHLTELEYDSAAAKWVCMAVDAVGY